MEKTIQHIVWIKLYHGVTDELEYTVDINGKIQDIGLWRTVINGYPYKSMAELGVADLDEAFTATKQAVYCYLFENEPEDYEAIGEAGERTLNALKNIVSSAQSSTEMPNDPACDLVPESSEWQEDEANNEFVSKVYYIKSDSTYADYEITINDGMPEGGKITKLDGIESTKFSSKEKFKIMLPKEKLIEDGEFTLSVKTEVKTKPVLYGASPNAEWQNYALSAYMLEDAEATFKDNYKKIEKPEVPEEPKKPEKPTVPEAKKTPDEIKILPVTGM